MKPLTVVTARPLASGDPFVRALAASGLVERLDLLVPPGAGTGRSELGGLPCREITTAEPGAGEVVAALFHGAPTPGLLEVHGDFDPHPTALARLVATIEGGAGMVYGDWTDATASGPVPHPVADYQRGSLEDGFAFGPLRAWSVAAAQAALGKRPLNGLRYHGWYALRLELAEQGPIVHLPEPLGTLRPTDTRASGQRVFDYLTATRERQVEAEAVVTAHLDRVGALVRGPFAEFVPSGTWPVEASVVIPVRNRVRTVMDAVESALTQRTSFPFNVVVVDNHSTDGTTEALRERAAEDSRLVHVVPDRQDLGIGGCWNVAVNHPAAGRYVVQLDSDDVYGDEHTLARMVALLSGGRCGLAVGSYTLVNMAMETIPPGLIDHREWTDENGPNNALRIGGLGAPRGYATELLRRHPFPNASYGEDYAAVLRISREWKVGRIYDSLYACRRWEENSDADLNHATKARYQTYKDRIRTLELEARIRRNR